MPDSILRQAKTVDIPEMFRIRHAVRENRLFEGVVISAADVCCAIEETGRGWVIELESSERAIAGFAIGNAVSGNVWALFVDPAAEGRGYGQRLHAAMTAWLWSHDLEMLWLTTDPGTRA